MPIPQYDQLMLPVLRHSAEHPWAMRELVARMADGSEPHPGRTGAGGHGGTKLIASRVHWAKTFLKQAGLVEQPKRGVIKISPRGADVLSSHPPKIDVQLLQRFPEFQAFVNRTKSPRKAQGTPSVVSEDASPLGAPSSTPEEQNSRPRQVPWTKRCVMPCWHASLKPPPLPLRS